MTTACKDCGSSDIRWFSGVRNTSGVQDGRLKLNEVEAIVVLGCNECSATLEVLTGDEYIARQFSEINVLKLQADAWKGFHGSIQADFSTYVDMSTDAIKQAKIGILQETREEFKDLVHAGHACVEYIEWKIKQLENE